MKTLYSILILATGIFGTSCVTETVQENPVRVIDENTYWQLGEFPVKPGWSKDDLDVPMVLSPVPEEPPLVFEIRGDMPTGNQGPQASGTAWAAGFTGVTFLYKITYNEPDYICSPAFVYNQLNRGKNQGVELFDALLLLREQGCPDIRMMPYKPFDFLYKPDAEAIRNAASHRISDFARVDYTDISQIKGQLIQGRPVFVTLKIFDNFIELREKNWLRPIGKPRGRHTVVITGYNENLDLLTIHNSAGSEWGDNGKATISYSWFIRLAEKAYVMW